MNKDGLKSKLFADAASASFTNKTRRFYYLRNSDSWKAVREKDALRLHITMVTNLHGTSAIKEENITYFFL